jgi:hypothetical protein
LPVFLIGGNTEDGTDAQASSQGLLQYQSAFADQKAFPGVVAVPEVREEGEGGSQFHPKRIAESSRNFETIHTVPSLPGI